MLDRIRNGCRVGFLGLGKSNASLLSALPLNNCEIVIRSDKEIDRDQLPNVSAIYIGDDAMKNIDEEILFLSPSVRRDRAEIIDAVRRGVILNSDYELFLSENKKPIFAVTGSDGKSTTARLLTLLLRAGGHRASEIGNMGEPMVSHLSDDCEFYTIELSSYMLSAKVPRVKMAALTSLTPNHLDWHGSYENYKKTKISLLKSSDNFVISDENADIHGAYGIISLTRSYRELRALYPAEVYMTAECGYIKKNGENIVSISDIVRKEPHNLKNLMMAIAMADGYADSDAVGYVARSFPGLKHRCERFLSSNGIDYYDSSIDTTPARTAETLRSLGRRCVIILGGRGKGLDYSIMKDDVAKFVHAAVIVGENKHEILSKIKNDTYCYLEDSFEDAVMLGKKLAEECGVLLLSPASTSYDMFKSFEDRGERFKNIIKEKENEENLS